MRMEKLKKLIVQLPEHAYGRLESDLISNKSEKFLLLLQTMRKDNAMTGDLLARLHCNENALYVLKSRLYDKVQKHLVQHKAVETNNTDKSLSAAQILFDHPRETAIAMLKELEKKYLQNDIPGELIDIYSALKKAHYNTDKYYHYSQLYNKQVAYTVALEKAEDVSFTFNRTLSSYYFSRSSGDLELIRVMKNEISNIYALNRSHRIELLKNFIAIQTQLYTPLESQEEAAAEDLLERCEEITRAFPDDKHVVYYTRAINFLRFEYYLKINQPKKAQLYFELTEQCGPLWLLLSPVCQAHRFLQSKLYFVTRYGKPGQVEKLNTIEYADNNDFYTEVVLRFYKGVVRSFEGKLKEASQVLNDLINEASFKDCFFMESQVKLTLAYFYIQQTQYELAENLLKSLSRKLIDDKKEQFSNVKACIRVLLLLMDNKDSSSARNKLRKAIEQFNLYNTGDNRILDFIQFETGIEMPGEAA